MADKAMDSGGARLTISNFVIMSNASSGIQIPIKTACFKPIASNHL
jgi:hypothetical protein